MEMAEPEDSLIFFYRRGRQERGKESEKISSVGRKIGLNVLGKS